MITRKNFYDKKIIDFFKKMVRHQTLHKKIKPNVNKLRAHHLIKKIIIGPYENCRHKYSPGKIKIQKTTTNGFKLNGYDGSGVYCLFLYWIEGISESEKKTLVDYIENKF